MVATTIDLAEYIRHRWKFMHMFRNLRNLAWLDDSRASYADWAADERRELLACLAERRVGLRLQRDVRRLMEAS